MESNIRSHLRRLDDGAYKGPSCGVHWSMTIDGRATGWLNREIHLRLREILMHALVRYHLLCPVYTLMPDHGHFLLMGWDEASDQKRAVSMLRRQWNRLLRPRWELQHQPHDSVLRDKDKERAAFERMAYYIAQNPVEDGLATEASEYPFWGAIFPGKPELDPRSASFWTTWWYGYNRLASGKGR